MSENEMYFGQLDPRWKENAQQIIDEQKEIMINAEKNARQNSLPKEILIFGGGTLLILTILIIYKYKK